MAGRCDKLAGVDVAAYLEAPDDARWSGMRAHVEKCRDCSEEVEAWRSLRASLAVEGGGHPTEELLLAYADERSTLASRVAEGIESHLTECASCRDEVGVLGVVAIQSSEAASVSVRAEEALWHRIAAALSGPVWLPALAVALLVVLMAPALRWRDQRSALMQLGVERNDETMIVLGANDAARPVAEGATKRPAPAPTREPAPTPAPAAPAEPRAVPPTLATPPPLGKGGTDTSVKVMPVLPDTQPSPTTEDAARSALSRENPAVDFRRHEAQRQENRDAIWFGGDSLSAVARSKERGLAPAMSAPILNVVPGGRTSLPAGEYNRVVLRVRFARRPDTRAHAEPPHADQDRLAAAKDGIGPIVISPDAAHVELQITTVDGHKHRQRVEIGSSNDGPGTLTEEIVIPAEWLRRGENHVSVLDGEGRALGDRFSVER